MTLLTVVKDVCAAVGVLQPQSVFTNITGNRTMQEMVSLANEMAQRIAYDTRDWTRLRTVQTYTGDAVTTAFDLPANYKRMLLTANVWRSTSTQQPMIFIPDPDEWIMRRAAEQTDAWGEWTMMGGQMHIHPALGADETAFFVYLDKNCVTLNAGGFGDTFVNDADTFRLDERVFKLGMIWEWKNKKGAPYTEDLGTYGDALAIVSGHDGPAPIIIGRKSISVIASAYPGANTMSVHQMLRRVAVPPQMASKMETTTIPAPVRGLALSENEAYMQPGGALVMDNWKPTLRGAALRGGCERWCDLPETTPVISAFNYISGINHRMYAANATKIYDVTTTTPVEVASGRTSGNYAASQLANAAGDYLIIVNDAGDQPMRFDGTTWYTMTDADITGPPLGVELVYVCKYRNRLFFIERNSMNAWYLGINAISGAAGMVPLSGAASKGGKLLFCAVWSLDAGDGIDDKLVFCTDLGELLIFTGSNPADADNWRQEGRYELSPPLGMNAHIQVGGDLLVATVDGILPVSAAISKGKAELELAAVTRNIKSMWRDEVLDKRDQHWTLCNWHEYGGIFVTLPGGAAGQRRVLGVNSATGAWCRFTGWDCMCFIRMRGDMFFGTQDGIIMQADRTGYDDGVPYVCTLVGGWEMFQSPAQTITWRQARAHFTARAHEPFIPQLAATTDYVVTIPPPPLAGADTGVLDLWDQGLWDQALWDQPQPSRAVVRNTGWVSIGQTGFSHAPIVQVTVAQAAKPVVELISIAATFERAGITV